MVYTDILTRFKCYCLWWLSCETWSRFYLFNFT